MASLKRKAGVLDSESSYSSSSEDVTEDEHGVELTPALDAAILKTLGKIRRGEGVYGSEDVLGEALREAEARAGHLKVASRKSEKVCCRSEKLVLTG